MGDSRAGNRFDSYSGGFSVLYFASILDGCFGETLSRFRPDPALAFIDDEWQAEGFMQRGQVPRDWRTRRLAVRVSLPQKSGRFIDVSDAETAVWLHDNLAPALVAFGYNQLDPGLLQGPDRRVTRLVSDFIWSQTDEAGEEYVFDGIRYHSRLNPDWDCWAVYDDVEVKEEERLPVLPSMDSLQRVASLFRLRIF